MPVLRFSEADHRYFLDDEEIPSVSRILEKIHSRPPGIPQDVWELAQERGIRVAAAVRLLLDDDLDEEDLDEALVPRIQAFKDWMKLGDFVPDVARCEVPTYNTVNGLHYGMTPDLPGLWKGKPAIVDVKCTYKNWESHHAIQLAGYAGENRPVRMVLNLGRDGVAKLHEFTDERDYTVFAAALTCTWWEIDQAKPKRKKKKT